MRNISIEIVSCHVKINQPSQLLPQNDDDKYLRKHKEYKLVRENLKQLVTHLMFKNKTILFEHVDDWLQDNVIVKNSVDRHDIDRHEIDTQNTSSGYYSNDSKNLNISKNSCISNNPSTKNYLQNSSTLQKDSIIMPRLRIFLMDLINRTFTTNTSLPIDIKNWIMIASVHMIGVIICECFQNQIKSGTIRTENKNSSHSHYSQDCLSKIIKLVAGTVSDYITTRHIHFIESVGSWTQLRHYFVTKNGQLIFNEEMEPVESSATSNASSLYPESEATSVGDGGGLDILLPSLIAGAVATLGVLTYAKLK